MPPRSLALRVTALVALAVGFSLAYVQSARLSWQQLDAAIDAEDLLNEYWVLGIWPDLNSAEGVSSEWRDQAATANCGPEGEAGSNRWPNLEPSAPL
jgi:hypothetical protein